MFGVTIDYLVNGNIEEKAKMQDAELLQQFKEVEKMNDDDRLIVRKLIDALLPKGNENSYCYNKQNPAHWPGSLLFYSRQCLFPKNA